MNCSITGIDCIYLMLLAIIKNLQKWNGMEPGMILLQEEFAP